MYLMLFILIMGKGLDYKITVSSDLVVRNFTSQRHTFCKLSRYLVLLSLFMLKFFNIALTVVQHKAEFHKGMVIKFNANQRYATTAITANPPTSLPTLL